MKKPPRIIGLYSPAPRSGKSTIAEFFTDELGYKRIPFAEILKEMARPLLRALGYSEVDIYRMETGNKMDMVAGKTLRHIYQTLGTEWGRDCIDQDLWVSCWEFKAQAALKAGYAGVIADDTRFLNEVTAIRHLKGEFWRVERPEAKKPNKHSSEGQLDHLKPDRVIVNNSTLEDLLLILTQEFTRGSH